MNFAEMKNEQDCRRKRDLMVLKKRNRRCVLRGRNSEKQGGGYECQGEGDQRTGSSLRPPARESKQENLTCRLATIGTGLGQGEGGSKTSEV